LDAYLAFKLLAFLGSVCLGCFLDTFSRVTRFSRLGQEVNPNFFEATALILFERRLLLTCNPDFFSIAGHVRQLCEQNQTWSYGFHAF
jgi:hypothetical protein